ncbi:MBL fold metallo-hydrolase [Aquimarina sp. I32.4]|uniref:MBL fold metallo-hydrolase n=1 Tax=Aquimarina sp. I32.4 TaxID=2053903 RepID=UPI001E5B6E28|nr:MBL fold metallo-hydrolase [Aquimarina sp. I32.4]
MLTGQGGNITIFKNEKGLFIIDDQFARLSNQILSSLKTISDQPVTTVINTHFHGDHTGGNENMANNGATIFAQKNVRSRMKKQQQQKR